MATATTVTKTGNPEIDGLLWGTKWTGPLTYSFPDSSGDYRSPYSGTAYNEPTHGFTPASDGVQDAITHAAGLVSQYTNLSIQYAGNDYADIMVAHSSSANPEGAHAYYPLFNGYASEASGDVWIGTSNTPSPGNYGFYAVLHEFGHAIGLKHPHEKIGVASIALPLEHDFMEYSVMSYRPSEGARTNPVAPSYPLTYMANDILALQTLYGANYGTNSGNTVYTWDPATGQGFVDGVGQPIPTLITGTTQFYQTIWDGGGIDTYDMSRYIKSVNIDLNPGAASKNIHFLDMTHDIQGKIYNAYLFNGDTRSLIENANGGFSNDTITGNQAANVLNGNAGNDVLYGLAGNDTLIGGVGNDRLDGGTGNDTLEGGAGNDVFICKADSAGATTDYVMDFGDSVGNEDIIDLFAVVSNVTSANFETWKASNVTQAGANVDVRFGDDRMVLNNFSAVALDFADFRFCSPGVTLNGTNANDSLTGNDLNDVLSGLAGNDSLSGWAGNDTLYGGDGSDRLYGGADDDVLDGGAGSDALYGDDGNDTLRVGGTEVDYVAGGAGIDTLYLTADATLGKPNPVCPNNVLEIENIVGNGHGINGTASMDNFHLEDITAINLAFVDGGAGNDWITGNAASNTLRGGDDNDILDGGGGSDTLTGGAGNDTFVFKTEANGPITDYITDFGDSAGNEDVLDLTEVVTLRHGDIFGTFSEWKSKNVTQSGVDVDIRINDNHHIVLANYSADAFNISDALSVSDVLFSYA
jgi:serralysin